MQQQERPLQAVGLILAAMFLLALFDNFVARLARDIGLWQFHLMRAALAMALLGVLAVAGLVDLRARRLWAVALRGGLTALSMLIYFGALAFLSVAESAAGLFSAPLWVLLLSVLMGERPRPVELGAALLGFVGVLLVLDPFSASLGAASLLPMLAGLFYALGSIATRAWCAGEGVFAMLLWYFVVLAGIGAAALLALWLWPQEVPEGAAGFLTRGWVWPVSAAAGWYTLLQALAAVVAVAVIFRAYQLGEARFVAVFEYALLLFAAFWGWALWGQVPGARAWAGMGLIVLSGAALALAARTGGTGGAGGEREAGR